MDYEAWARSYEQTADQLSEMVHQNVQRIKHTDVATSCKSLITAKIHRDRKLIRRCRRVAAALRKRRESQ